MSNLIQTKLLNGSYGDPLIYCSLPHIGRAFTFDLGASFELVNGDLQRIDNVYLSHAHMDHLFGFEHFLRANVKQRRVIEIFGPPDIHKRIHGKLQGFTWNLVQYNGLEFLVHEIQKNKLVTYRMRCREQFKLRKVRATPLKGKLVLPIQQAEHFSVVTAALDHKTVSQGYAVTDNPSVSINQDALDKRGWRAGPWLQELKQLALAKKTSVKHLTVPSMDGTTQSLKLSQLKEELILPRKRHKIAYVSDAIYNKENAKRIISLASDADLFYCESTFMHQDLDKAQETFHLTAQQTGKLAKEAGVERLVIFHFSKKYMVDPRPLIDQASEAFGKEVQAFPYYKALNYRPESSNA